MMENSPVLVELAAKVEAATGPTHVLWLEIYDTLHPGERDARFAELNKAYGRRLGPADRDGYTQPRGGNFLASLDAAMTLVPEGCRLRGLGQGKSGAWTADIVDRDHRCIGIGSAKGPALALAAACLRSLANKETNNASQ
jgi:hypothetical protein